MIANKGRPALIATGLSRARLVKYFRTVRGDIPIPSLRSSSLAMRSSPERPCELGKFSRLADYQRKQFHWLSMHRSFNPLLI